MAKVFDGIDERLAAFLAAQPVFFVGTAPTDVDGHVNVSPKGLDSFRVLGSHEVAYLDLNGSGAETIAHLRDNGRIVVMVCAFSGPPRIVRLHGRGEVVLPDDPRFAALAAGFPAELPPARSIIRIDVTRVSDSCGFGVPTMSGLQERDLLQRWASTKDDADLEAYRAKHNRTSVDGLPAVPPLR